MRKFLIVTVLIYIVSIPLLPRVGPGQTGEENSEDFTGVFVLRGDFTLRVSVDYGWERNGWIPVIFSFSHLEASVRVKADDPAYAAGIEAGISEMLGNGLNLPFLTYERNPLRTRMELSDKSTPVKLEFKGGNKRVEFYIGDSRLKLDPIRAAVTEITPGEQYELTFTGPNVHTHSKFIYMPFRGTIYAARRYGRHANSSPDPDNNREWTVWAVESVPEKGKGLRLQEIK